MVHRTYPRFSFCKLLRCRYMSPYSDMHFENGPKNLNVRTKTLIAMVALGNLAGEGVTFVGGFANTTGWDILKFPCECAWTVLAFPLGWLGLVGGSFAAKQLMLPYFYLFLWTGVTLNACLWGWVACRFVRCVRGQAGYSGFDASTISSQIAEVRHRHTVSAHSRWRPSHARKGLIGAARRAIGRCAYFLRTEPARRQETEGDSPK